MSLARTFRINRILLVTNCVLLVGVVSVSLWKGFSSTGGTIEANRIVLKGKSGAPHLVLQGDDAHPLMTFHDKEGNVRLQLQGGVFPAMVLKNEAKQVVGSFFPLKDGGAAIGLGDVQGEMATFIRGGDSPTMSFFHKSHEPNVALGISNKLPHFVMFPMEGKEGLFIHGNSPTSVLFIDENGEVPVSLSRHGLMHDRGEPEAQSSDQEKIFSLLEAIKHAKHEESRD